MKSLNKRLTTAILISSLAPVAAQAALFDRGNGMIYDSTLNITWQQNMNLAFTETFGVTGIGNYGQMNWNKANEWIGAMNNSNYFGFNDWRLPKADPINGVSYNFANPDQLAGNSNNFLGDTDWGHNITSPNSELSHLFYVSLNNLGYTSTSGVLWQPGWNLFSTNTEFNDGDDGAELSFQNIEYEYVYLTGSEVVIRPDRPLGVLAFDFGSGDQRRVSKNQSGIAWAVRDGDVASVPVPAAAWFMATGLLGLISLRKRAG